MNREDYIDDVMEMIKDGLLEQVAVSITRIPPEDIASWKIIDGLAKSKNVEVAISALEHPLCSDRTRLMWFDKRDKTLDKVLEKAVRTISSPEGIDELTAKLNGLKALYCLGHGKIESVEKALASNPRIQGEIRLKLIESKNYETRYLAVKYADLEKTPIDLKELVKSRYFSFMESIASRHDLNDEEIAEILLKNKNAEVRMGLAGSDSQVARKYRNELIKDESIDVICNALKNIKFEPKEFQGLLEKYVDEYKNMISKKASLKRLKGLIENRHLPKELLKKTYQLIKKDEDFSHSKVSLIRSLLGNERTPAEIIDDLVNDEEILEKVELLISLIKHPNLRSEMVFELMKKLSNEKIVWLQTSDYGYNEILANLLAHKNLDNRTNELFLSKLDSDPYFYEKFAYILAARRSTDPQIFMRLVDLRADEHVIALFRTVRDELDDRSKEICNSYVNVQKLVDSWKKSVAIKTRRQEMDIAKELESLIEDRRYFEIINELEIGLMKGLARVPAEDLFTDKIFAPLALSAHIKGREAIKSYHSSREPEFSDEYESYCEVEILVAKHPRCPDKVRMILLDCQDEYISVVRRAAAAMICSGEGLEYLKKRLKDQNADKEIKIGAAKNQNIQGDVRLKLMKDSSDEVRRLAVKYLDLERTDFDLKKAARSRDVAWREGVASRHDLDDDLIGEQLIKDSSSSVIKALASSDSPVARKYRKLIMLNGGSFTKREALKNIKFTPEEFEEFFDEYIKGKGEVYLEKLILNPHLPEELLRKAYKLLLDELKNNLISNPKILSALRVCVRGLDELKNNLISNPKTPSDVIDDLVKNIKAYEFGKLIRLSAHPNLTSSGMTILLQRLQEKELEEYISERRVYKIVGNIAAHKNFKGEAVDTLDYIVTTGKRYKGCGVIGAVRRSVGAGFALDCLVYADENYGLHKFWCDWIRDVRKDAGEEEMKYIDELEHLYDRLYEFKIRFLR